VIKRLYLSLKKGIILNKINRTSILIVLTKACFFLSLPPKGRSGGVLHSSHPTAPPASTSPAKQGGGGAKRSAAGEAAVH